MTEAPLRPTTARRPPRPLLTLLPAALLAAAVLAAAVLTSCAGRATSPVTGAPGATHAPDAASAERIDDPHSYAEPWDVAVSHLGLDLTVDFDRQLLSGRADLTLAHHSAADTLYLDTHGLDVERVTLDDGEATRFELGREDPILGQRLAVRVTPATRAVHVEYSSRPTAAAVQWLSAEQTAGGEHPFLFTQSEAILARTWIPLQDTPSVRITYDATIRVPPGLMAVMSAAGNPTAVRPDGVYRFSMPQPIPSYLLALAAGDLAFRGLGERAGVYAEPPVADGAAWELAETERMIAAAESLFGPYRWGRYDLLILPPSFPFGGMENPRLTFATPTILAGDRSLVALVAHELGHSWSGNLVTNATWDDFWLNEGFTVYVERRIMEELRGREYAEMLAALGRTDLDDAIAGLGPSSPDTRLHLDLAGRDPDDGMTDVAYEKGYFFLRMLEEAVGRERWDPFLRSWFDRHAFQPATTAEFLADLDERLLAPAGIDPADLEVERWVYAPGLPENVPRVVSARFAAVDRQVGRFTAGTPAGELAVDGWSSHEWLRFLRGLPPQLTAERLADLDAAFGLSDSGNSELLAAWLMIAIRNDYRPAYPALARFLTGMGRRKFLAPLYAALAATPEGRERARRIYAEARPGYHAIARGTIDDILDWQADGLPEPDGR